jgi:hypothetical protein
MTQTKFFQRTINKFYWPLEAGFYVPGSEWRALRHMMAHLYLLIRKQMREHLTIITT